MLDDRGTAHPYDELVLATGSAARVPPIQGVAYDERLVEGVFVLKDMADATGIVAAARPGAAPWCSAAGVLGRRGGHAGWPAGAWRCASCTSPTG